MKQAKTSSRLLALLLSLTLVIGMLPTTVFAETAWGGTGVAEVKELGGDLYAEGNNLVVKNGSDGDLTQIYYANTNGVTVGNPINLSEISSDITGDTTGGFDLKNVSLSATHNGTFNNDTGAFANHDVVIWMEGGTLADISAGNINAQCKSFTVHMSGGTLTSVVTAFNSAIAAHTIYISGGRIEKNQAAQHPLYLSGSPSIGGEDFGITVKDGETFYLNGALSGASVYVVPKADFIDGTVIAEGSGGYQITENDISQLHLTGDYAQGKELYLENDAVKIRTSQPAVNQEPYEISTPEQLMKFAALVNGENNGANAVLTADIDMSSQSWSGIASNQDYTGVFDGQGHTIFNLTGTEGLFANNSGTVKNVRLENVSITREGGNLGAVVGVNTGTVFNCVSSGSITGNGSNAYSIGGIIGHNNGGTLSGSASSCTVDGRTAGGLVGSNWQDDGNYGIITACIYTGDAGKPVEGDHNYSNSTNVYYKDENGVWKSYPGNGEADETTLLQEVNAYITENGGTFILSGDGTTYPTSAVSYLDHTENGFVTKYAETYTEINSENLPTTWNDGWYVVDDDVTIDSRVTVNGDVNLILTDGQTLTCSQGINVPHSSSLTIYAQAEGSGALTAVTSSNAAIGSNDWGTWGDITICGGHITATSEGQAGIGGGYHSDAHGNVSIYGGVIETSGIHGGTPHYGASDMGNILIQGATVTSNRQIGAGLSLSGSTSGISSCGSITIRDSIVQTQSFLGSSSSSWYTGTCGDITVSNSTVLVQGAIGGTDSTLHLNGNTCIVAERSVLTMPESLSGVLVFGTSGTAYSDTQISDIVDLSGISLTVQPGTTLTLPNDAILRSLTVETGAQVQAASDLTVNNATVSGAITVPGTLHNNGTLTVNQDGVISCGSFSNSGTMTTQGQVTARTSFHNAGAVNNSSTGVLNTSGGINDGVMENTGTWVNQGPITGSGVVVSNTEISGAGDQQIAPDAISYLNEDGEVAYIGANDIIYPLTSQVKTWAKFDGATTWYVVTKDTQIDGGVKVTDDVNLLLMDGATLTVNGANYNGGINAANHILNIYAQSNGSGMGKLTANGGHYNWMAIGGENATVNIHGGFIDVSETNSQYAGIGAGIYRNSGEITVSGGLVKTQSIGRGNTVGNQTGGLYAPEDSNAIVYTNQTNIGNAAATFHGILFLQKTGTVYGNQELAMDLTIEDREVLTVPAGTTWTIPSGVTLTVKGELIVEGTLDILGTVVHEGTIENPGAIRVKHGGDYTGEEPTPNSVTYQIDWDTDGDGTVDDTTYVAYGETPNHANGSKEPTLDTAYTFTGWDSAVVAVTGTATYTAQFSSSVRTYTVTVPSDPGYSVAYTGNTTLEYGSTFTFTVDIAHGYYKTSSFAVKANGSSLTPDTDGNYTVRVLEDTRITIEGVAQEAALAAPAVDTHGYNSEWTANDVTLTLSASADSGIAYYEYSKNGGESWTKLTGESLTISESNLATDYIFRAVSNAGNTSAGSESVTVKIDKNAPSVNLTGNTGDYLQEDSIRINLTVGLSGISKVELKKVNGAWETLSPSDDSPNTYFYTVTENGTYTFRITSRSGLTATASITYDKIDSVKPVVSIDSGNYTADTWTNQDVTLSVSNTAANSGTTTFQYKVDDGDWQTYTDSITISEETAGTTYTFKAISASGVESDETSITVKLDQTAPDGDIKIQENSVKKLLNQITFGLFFNQNVDVDITGTDALSGVASIQFYRSDDILTQEDVAAITDWIDYSSITETAADAEKFVYYAKITDQAGNFTVIGSNGVTFDLTAPTISGITNGSTYYTTQNVTVADANLATVTVNGVPEDEALTLAGNVAQTYTIVATDKAGNKTEYTVTMKPIESLGDPIQGITTDNVTSADQTDIQSVQQAVAGVDTENATQAEQDALKAIADHCATLLDKVTEVADEMDALTQAVNALPDGDTITSAHKDTVNDLMTRLDTLLDGSNLTEGEKDALEAVKAIGESLLQQIEQSAQAGTTENTDKVEDITPGNVSLEDQDDLTAAKEDLENALDNFGDNYTEEEKAALEDKLEQINQALESIQKVEAAQDAMEALPDHVEPDDTDAAAILEAVKEQYDALTEHEKSLVDEALKDKLDSLLAALVDYQIIEGNNSQWTVGENQPLTITANGAFAKFVGIQVDGVDVDAGNYTAVSGSTIITLKPDYLSTLSVGKHTLTVRFTDGQADGQFEILAKPETSTPDTGDNNQVTLWITVMFVAVCGLTGTMVYTSKKKHSK